MFLAVVGFYTVIPKLYNLGLKGNPALNHAEESTDVPENKLTTEKAEDKPDAKKANGKDIPFQGAGIQKVMAKTGDTVMSTSWLKKLADKFDFDGPSMSVTAMLTLLFGFCLPPRYINGQDKYDKKKFWYVIYQVSQQSCSEQKHYPELALKHFQNYQDLH